MDIWKAAHDNDFGAVEYLLKDGEVSVDERNSIGETALHVAASRGFDNVVDLLLRHGADPNAQDKESGYTPLHRSFLHGHLNASLLLLNGGAMLSADESPQCVLDNDGLSPLDLLSTRLERDKSSTASATGGEIYTFGKVDFQLGYHLPHGDEQYIPRRVKFPPGVDLVGVSAAMYHTLAVSSTGQCYSWGFGKGGRLGTGSEFNCIHPVQLHFPLRVVVKASAGENHSLALTSNGHVYSWGSNSFGQLGFPVKTTNASSRLSPKRIDAFKGVVIVDIAAASSHSAAITSSGHVFTWGSNKKGQLGRKEGFGTDQALPTPKRVDSLLPHNANPAVTGEYTSVVATKIAVSCHHTCVILRVQRDLCDQGQVWQWGWGAFFPSQVILRHHSREEKLRQQHQNIWLPRAQQYPISIVDISCAPLHSIGLSSLGNVYTWGHGPNPLGGLNYVPLHDRATSVAAAKEHCAVVLQSGDVYTWGCGTLGHEGRNWQPIPKRVARVKQATGVVAGPQHTAVLVAPRRPSVECGHDTLLDQCQHVLREQVTLQSVIKLFAKADMLDMIPLQEMCRQFVAQNLDAVLEMTKNVEEWPIELDEVGTERQLLLQAQEEAAPVVKASTAVTEIPIKKDIEKKLRSLRKRVDQLNDLELLVSLNDSQKAKLKRKPDLQRQIQELSAQLPPPPPAPPAAEKPNEAKTRTPETSQPKASRRASNAEKKSKVEVKRNEPPKNEVEEVKPSPSPSLTAKPAPEPKAPKGKAKFVPLDSFLAQSKPPTPLLKPTTPLTKPLVPSTPPLSWVSPSLKPQMPPPMKLSQSPSMAPASAPLAGSGQSFSLECFMKPSRKSKAMAVVEEKKSWNVVAPAAAHSLTAIQAAEAIQVKQTWNLRENKWGLCQSENVNLADIQSIEMREKQEMEELIRQDNELAKKLQAEEFERAKRQQKRRAKGNRSTVRAA
ncbi:hypothetical protein LEN26_017590 [Aphanomyces euteiches]|nr:hypothetical protein LEN26_017590 [Aphanomyces euteiches]KAH9105989.1 hypothetical protein AeMF1_018284 [Aphanomyces euteiches]KAH9196981.1 hypothetical protein AeNC1_001060 [Aphanomyces euteiches]